MRRGEKIPYCLFHAGGLVIFPLFQETLDCLWGGRKTNKVEMEAPDEGNRIGVRGGFQSFTAQTVQNKVINPVCRPIRRLSLGDGMPFRGTIGPGLSVTSTLFDPLA